MKQSLKLAAVLLIAIFGHGLAVAQQSFEEDVHYFSIFPEQPGGEGDRVKVSEFFLYTCPHCDQLEPHLDAWLKRKPANVDFDRVPAMFNRETIKMHGKTFYALRLMGLSDTLHAKIFHAIHNEGEQFATQGDMEAFLEEQGVDLVAYRKAMKSFAVNTQARRAEALADRYEVRAVPSIVIDGKYRVTGLVGEAMMKVTDYLIGKVERERGITTK
ncbi:MAG: thiol:disulfide interchange protein DsbA/DsbL [Gammaproteobacteria bacterium]|nr:thiol:disulfide interchange protein DsbA/DsbL [Gammaproteobacteria bacterium]